MQTNVDFLSVVMPVYNEEASIERVILDHVAALERLTELVPQWEILCVDDGSTDRTLKLLERLRASVPQLRVIRHTRNQGIYSSFSHLYREARGSHIYSTGADGQWPPENLDVLLRRLLGGAALVVGVRTNRRRVYSLRRQVVSFLFNALPRLLFGVPVRDAGSVKLGVRDVFAFDLISRSPFFEAERIIKAHRAGYTVGFAPVQFRRRGDGKAKGASWRNIVTSVRDLRKCLGHYGLR